MPRYIVAMIVNGKSEINKLYSSISGREKKLQAYDIINTQLAHCMYGTPAAMVLLPLVLYDAPTVFL